MLTLAQYRDLIYQRIRESSGNSSFDTTIIDDLINEGVLKMGELINWSELDYIEHLLLPYSFLSSTSTGATLHLTSASNFFIGQRIMILEGSYCELMTITGITGNDLTVDPPTPHSYTTAASVSGYSIRIRENKLVRNVNLEQNLQDKGQTGKVSRISERLFNKLVSKIESKGKPIRYFIRKYDDKSRLGITLAASSTTIVARTGVLTEDLTGWLLVNRNRNAAERILSFDTTTGYATLEVPIAAQVAGDVVDIYRKKDEVIVYPPPDQSYPVAILMQLIPPKLLNTYDVPYLASRQYNYAPIYWALNSLSEIDGLDLATSYGSKFNALMLLALSNRGDLADEVDSMEEEISIEEN